MFSSHRSENDQPVVCFLNGQDMISNTETRNVLFSKKVGNVQTGLDEVDFRIS